MPRTILSQERQGEKQVDVQYANNLFTSMVNALKNNNRKNFLSRLALELHPTGEVPEYTATIAYALLREGKEGRHKVDSVKFVIKAESKFSNNLNDITSFLFYF